jgi:CxxC motif-containing protein (DUF1111 family)
MTSRRKLSFASVFGPTVAVLAVLSMGQVSPTSDGTFGDPLPGLTAAEQARFSAGKTSFESPEGVSDGLGPVFNENSCVACHTVVVGTTNVTGGGSSRLETRFGLTPSSTGVFDPLDGSGASGLNLGGSLMQDHAIGGPFCCDSVSNQPVTFVPEVVPSQANTVAQRRTTPLFGLGLVDNVPDQTLINLQAQTGGTANMVFDVASGQTKVGRFGWKCQQASLFAFSGDAYLNEMGITTPRFPASNVGFIMENCPQGMCSQLGANPGPSNPPDRTNDADLSSLVAFTDFMTFLGAPPQKPQSGTTNVGQNVFFKLGCNVCHVPSLTTGPNSSGALNRVTFFPYSDFLLHDMGSLGDGIVQGSAGPRMMRTAPLWGVRLQTVLLHDGRASSIRQAILMHAGQAQAARDGFVNINPNQQSGLIDFLKTL